jgi:hypothetical protein
MSLPRALRLPFQMASLLFVALIAIIMEAFGGPPELKPFRLLVIYILLSWLNKYAFALLELAANGSREAPVASAEMLGPFGDARAFIHPTLAAGIALTVAFVSSPAADIGALVVGLLMPASLATLAISPNALDSLNPLVLVRVMLGLGAWYLALLAAAAVCALLLWWLYDAPGPSLLRFTVAALLVLSLYAFVGGVIHHRRLELAFEPRNSPERIAERAEQARLARRQQAFDEIYGALRVREAARATAVLEAWLVANSGTRLALDVDAFIAQTATWTDPRGLAPLLRTVIAYGLRTRQGALSLGAAEAGIARLPGFTLEVPADLEALAKHARQAGRRRLAATLLDNYANGPAGGPLPATLAALRSDIPD